MSILPQLERDLHEAARRRLPEQRPGRSWRPRRAGLATLAGVAVALAVAVVALSLRGQQRPTPAAAPLAPPSSLGLHQLLDRFAVLRRPQTAAERRFRPYPESGFIPRFTRLATTLPDGERVYLTVSRVTDHLVGQPVGSYALSLWLVAANGKLNPLSGEPSYNHLWDYTQFPVLFGSDPRGSWVWAGIVPDGVKAVGWLFPPRTYVVPVHRNVAAGLLPGSAGAVTPTVVWYGSHGQIVKRLLAPVKYALSANGIAGARFGEPEFEVVSQLTQLLGKPRHPVVPSSQTRYLPFWRCDGIDLEIYWQDFDAFFSHGRFVAYMYWEQQVVPAWWPLLLTGRGLTIGETPAYARRLYGSSFRTSRARGGTWSLTTSGATLAGFTHGAAFGPGNTIATIQAGPSFCPAVAP